MATNDQIASQLSQLVQLARRNETLLDTVDNQPQMGMTGAEFRRAMLSRMSLLISLLVVMFFCTIGSLAYVVYVANEIMVIAEDDSTAPASSDASADEAQ